MRMRVREREPSSTSSNSLVEALVSSLQLQTHIDPSLSCVLQCFLLLLGFFVLLLLAVLPKDSFFAGLKVGSSHEPVKVFFRDKHLQPIFLC